MAHYDDLRNELRKIRTLYSERKGTVIRFLTDLKEHLRSHFGVPNALVGFAKEESDAPRDESGLKNALTTLGMSNSWHIFLVITVVADANGKMKELLYFGLTIDEFDGGFKVNISDFPEPIAVKPDNTGLQELCDAMHGLALADYHHGPKAYDADATYRVL